MKDYTYKKIVKRNEKNLYPANMGLGIYGFFWLIMNIADLIIPFQEYERNNLMSITSIFCLVALIVPVSAYFFDTKVTYKKIKDEGEKR